jgi:hypothetical protein
VARCERDGCDDIAIDFFGVSTRATLSHAGTKRLNSGDMVVLDYAQPAEISRSKHKVVSLFIPRARLRGAIGNPAVLAGQLLPRQGLAAVLRPHMLITMEQAMRMRPGQRIMAINAATGMALSILQIQASGTSNAEQFTTGIYHAAGRYHARLHRGGADAGPCRRQPRMLARRPLPCLCRARRNRCRRHMGRTPHACCNPPPASIC